MSTHEEGEPEIKNDIVFHWDVNKTIIMEDEASGQPRSVALNSILADTIEGFVHNQDGSDSWIAKDDAMDKHMPIPDKLETYYDFAEARNDKKARKALCGRFTEQGEPGERYRNLYTRMGKVLQNTDGYFIPSFVEAIRFLAQKRDTLRWRHVFRTFGTDLPEVIQHWNALCDQLGIQDRRVSQQGHFVRNVDTGELTLTLSTTTALPAEEDETKVITGLLPIHRHFSEPVLGTLALRDHFPSWKDSNTGKILIVSGGGGGGGALTPEKNSGADHHPRHYFFDDNAWHPEKDKNIIDVRSLDGTIVEDADARDIHFTKVDPMRAILDNDYYVNIISKLISE